MWVFFYIWWCFTGVISVEHGGKLTHINKLNAISKELFCTKPMRSGHLTRAASLIEIIFSTTTAYMNTY